MRTPNPRICLIARQPSQAHRIQDEGETGRRDCRSFVLINRGFPQLRVVLTLTKGKNDETVLSKYRRPAFALRHGIEEGPGHGAEDHEVASKTYSKLHRSGVGIGSRKPPQ